jgi:hypothetical protein
MRLGVGAARTAEPEAARRRVEGLIVAKVCGRWIYQVMKRMRRRDGMRC